MSTPEPGLARHAIERLSRLDDAAGDGQAYAQQYEDDLLAEEVPVALVYNGISHAVMMASPLDLEDFALGFSLSERIVAEPGAIYDLEIIEHGGQGLEVRMEIASADFMRLKENRRSLSGRTGCGLCGKDSLSAIEQRLPQVQADLQVPLSSLHRALAALQQEQVLNTASGALHAAAWVDVQGEILLLREDVGRHNALDKLIGALAKRGWGPQYQPGFCLLTSRASYELVQKAAQANIPLLATVSAPTSLAVNLAQQAGLSLIGFVRARGAVVYAHGQRLLPA